jgi:hypothetical protein
MMDDIAAERHDHRHIWLRSEFLTRLLNLDGRLSGKRWGGECSAQ